MVMTFSHKDRRWTSRSSTASRDRETAELRTYCKMSSIIQYVVVYSVWGAGIYNYWYIGR